MAVVVLWAVFYLLFSKKTKVLYTEVKLKNLTSELSSSVVGNFLESNFWAASQYSFSQEPLAQYSSSFQKGKDA